MKVKELIEKLMEKNLSKEIFFADGSRGPRKIKDVKPHKPTGGYIIVE